MAILQTMDREILEAATALGGDAAIRNDVVFFLADILPIVFIAVAIGLFLAGKTKHRRERNQNIVLIGLAGVLIAIGLRYLIISAVSRPRPFITYPDLAHVDLLPVDPSAFPSGHALYLFTFAGIIFFIGHHRKLGIALLMAAGVVAIARVVAGVHYPTDIIGGAIIGLLLAKLLSWQSSWVQRQVR